MKKVRHLIKKKVVPFALSATMVTLSVSGAIPNTVLTVKAANDAIGNDSLAVEIGDLGQIASMKIKNNRLSNNGSEMNFVLPNDTRNQNNTAHQWMGK